MGRSERRTAQTRAWVEVLVRSGLVPPEELVTRVADAVASDHRGLPPLETAQAWVDQARVEWWADAEQWSVPTDHDRLVAAFASLEAGGVVVLQGCADHWAAQAAVRELTSQGTLRGLAWFTPTDVWHAIAEGMLEVNLWHSTSVNAAPGDALLEEVLAVFSAFALPARFDEGRIEISMFWRRRP